MTTTESTQGFFARTVRIKVWHIVAAMILIPALVMWYRVVHQLDEIIALTRNEVVTDAAGNRLWYGAFYNTDDIVYRDVGTTVNFLDANGQTVGQARAEAAELAPGQELMLQSPLPAEAVRLRIYSVQWRNERQAAMMGPFREPWEFGYLMYNPRGY